MSERESEPLELRYFEGCGESLDVALHNASEKAKSTRQGWYHLVKIEVDVGDSLHDYKVLICPGGTPS
jgi:putative intracellular protease/amidase